jgi:PTS system nitrogen regulatory IIA component
MTLSPSDRAGPHIQFLAEISRVLTQPAVRERLLQTTEAQEVVEILTTAP